jgi:hypothetical protein
MEFTYVAMIGFNYIESRMCKKKMDASYPHDKGYPPVPLSAMFTASGNMQIQDKNHYTLGSLVQ